MTTKAKVLVPDREWIVEAGGTKLGGLSKEEHGFSFFKKGYRVELPSIDEVKAQFGDELFKESLDTIRNQKLIASTYSIYDYPCKGKPHNPVYNIKQRLPIYAKNDKSKSLFCAGYYLIRFKKGWAKAFCPKLITVERYEFKGPFKSEAELKQALQKVNNETT